jgi:ATP synthase protein I
MTTDTASQAAEQARAEALSELRLRVGALLVAGLACTVASGLLAGRTGVWGALVGLTLLLVFFGSSSWVMTRTRTLEPALVLVIAMGLYLLKILALALVVVVLSGLGLLGDPLHRVALAATIIVGALTWSAGRDRDLRPAPPAAVRRGPGGAVRRRGTDMTGAGSRCYCADRNDPTPRSGAVAPFHRSVGRHRPAFGRRAGSTAHRLPARSMVGHLVHDADRHPVRSGLGIWTIYASLENS